MKPYTYILKSKLDGKCYYGVRYAKDCHPDDLFVTYFSSSKIVHKLIEEHGPEVFTAQVRRTFDSATAAIDWEHRVLRRLDAAKHPGFLNLCSKPGLPSMPGDLNPMRDPIILARWKAVPKKKRGPQSPEHIEARRKALMGHEVSEETRQAISAANKGRVHSEEYRQMRSRLQTGKKHSEATLEKKRLAIQGRKRYTDGNSIKFFHPDTAPAGWQRC